MDEPQAKKAQVRIGFRSGNWIVIDVDSMKVTKDRSTNMVDSIEWTGGPHLLYMKLDQIEYVLESE